MNTLSLCITLVSFIALSQCTPTHVSSHLDFGGSSSSFGGSEGSSFGGDNHYEHHQEHHHEEYHEPRPYAFGYAVKDFKKGTNFNQHETNDGHHVKGEYEVALPDGRLQVVKYNADGKSGFHADVEYKGEAHHPELYATHESAGLEHHHHKSAY